MGKQVAKAEKKQVAVEGESDDSEDEVAFDAQPQGISDDSEEVVEPEVNDKEEMQKQFGLKAINDEEGMEIRLKEMQMNFYNRMESNRLLKKQGKIPFTEHMTISKQFS